MTDSQSPTPGVIKEIAGEPEDHKRIQLAGTLQRLIDKQPRPLIREAAAVEAQMEYYRGDRPHPNL